MDIVEAIAFITDEMTGVTLEDFAANQRQRWPVAGIGYILRHEHERVAYDVIWHVVRDDVPALEVASRLELAAANRA